MPFTPPPSVYASTGCVGENTAENARRVSTWVRTCHELVSQRRTAPSSTVASRLESGEKATAFTAPVCPPSVRFSCGVLVLQIFTVDSEPAVASHLPSGENAMERTELECANSVSVWSPSAASLHKRHA